jgi:hypothetical protein
VLARIAQLEPAPAVEFDRSGRFMRLSEAIGAVLSVLRSHGVEAEEVAEAAATEWYSRANIVELSREEFRILARKAAAPIEGPSRERVIASIDAAMSEALTEVSIDGGFRPEWTHAKLRARDRILSELAGSLAPPQLTALAAALSWPARE